MICRYCGDEIVKIRPSVYASSDSKGDMVNTICSNRVYHRTYHWPYL